MLFLVLFLPLTAQFGPRFIIDSTFTVSDITSLDLNLDGLPDIAISERYSAGQKVSYSLNQGNGAMGQLQVLDSVGAYLYHIEAGDLNGDGRMDLVATDRILNGHIFLFFNNPGGFTTSAIDSVTYIIDFKLSDVDLDGDLDIVSALTIDLPVMINDGNGNFIKIEVPPPLFPIENYALEMFDFDNDGDEDLLVGGDGLYIYRNDSGTFVQDSLGSATLGDSVRSCFELATGDLDNDGWEDVVYISSEYEIAWARNLGNGTFTFVQPIDTNRNSNFQLADLDQNGYLDLLYISADLAPNTVYALTWHANSGGFLGGPNQVTPSNFRSTNVWTEDLNADGKQDLIWGNSLSYHLNQTPTYLENGQEFSVKIFPNPAARQITVDLAGKEGKIRIFSLNGKCVKNWEFLSAGINQIELNLAGGLYIAEIDVNGERIRKKMLVK